MTLLGQLKKLSSVSSSLRNLHIQKEAGFASALSGAGKSIANKVKAEGPLGGVLSVGGGALTAAAIPGTVSSNFKNNKAKFNPQMHAAKLGL